LVPLADQVKEFEDACRPDQNFLAASGPDERLQVGVVLHLDVDDNQLRKWIAPFQSDPVQAFPGQEIMKPEHAEIERLRREVQKLKAERDISRKPSPASRRTTHDVLLHREAPGDMAGGFDLRGARLACQPRIEAAAQDTERVAGKAYC